MTAEETILYSIWNLLSIEQDEKETRRILKLNEAKTKKLWGSTFFTHKDLCWVEKKTDDQPPKK